MTTKQAVVYLCKQLREDKQLWFAYKANIAMCVYDRINNAKSKMLNFVGHLHEKWQHKVIDRETIAINVGVDVWDFYPISIDQILKYYYKINRKKLQI